MIVKQAPCLLSKLLTHSIIAQFEEQKWGRQDECENWAVYNLGITEEAVCPGLDWKIKYIREVASLQLEWNTQRGEGPIHRQVGFQITPEPEMKLITDRHKETYR